MVGDQGVERRQPRRGIRATVAYPTPAQRADDLVDLLGGLPCQILDGLQGAE
jgi:hypothetical protein